MIVQPETSIAWHRKGLKRFWKRKSPPGRPRIPVELRLPIGEVVRENPIWGQARIADELFFKLASRLLPQGTSLLAQPDVAHSAQAGVAILAHIDPQSCPSGRRR